MADSADRDVLWDVLEEHLSEAEFAIENLERTFDSPVVTLSTLASGIESRLLAHVDGLALGGGPVRKRLLDPAMAAPDPDRPFLLAAVGLALAMAFGPEALGPAMAHDDADVRLAAARACGLAGGPRVSAWIANRLDADSSPQARASVFRVCARLGVRVPRLVEWLQSGDISVARAAAVAVKHADSAVYLPIVEYLLDHPDAVVRDGALVAALAWGSNAAWSKCVQWALESPPSSCRLPMALSAALGGPMQHDALVAQLARQGRTRSALWALGFSGNARVIPALRAHLESEDASTRKLAAQAIAMITGLSLDTVEARKTAPKVPGELAPAEQDPEAVLSLPPLEEDDLDADLGPADEDALPDPDVAAVHQHCDRMLRQLAADRRLLGGKPFGLEVLISELYDAPLGRRHVLGLSLFIRSGATAWVDTRAFSAEQRRGIARASEQPRTRRFGTW
jgi:uncharacterized protein (TIGR02270 family)